jgi:hypothetical protein
MSLHNEDIFIPESEAEDSEPETDAEADAETDAADVVGALPANVVLTQRCAAELRTYLNDAKLAHFRIFHCPNSELYDIERAMEEIGEVAAWETFGSALVSGGEAIHALTHNDNDHGATLWEAGVLRLAKHEVVLARWYWVDADNYGSVKVLWLAASPSPQKFAELRRKVTDGARRKRLGSWQVVRGFAHNDAATIRRQPPGDLMLGDAIQKRVDQEMIGFFDARVAELYHAMGVPYRRGVLLHGAPGNGKTSLIRQVAHRLPDVSAMLLKVTKDFDSDDLEEVIRRWTAQAPAMLVIEDLNWLIKQVNVSTFLNLLDGVDTKSGRGGLLLIATSNYPEQLDPAVNNRPGRFDVVIELPPPDLATRLEFLRGKLPAMDAAVIEKVAAQTDRLSFAHLQEILRLSGLTAIHAGRDERSAEDLLSATEAVVATNEDAVRGFPVKPEVPFGLLPLHESRRR